MRSLAAQLEIHIHDLLVKYHRRERPAVTVMTSNQMKNQVAQIVPFRQKHRRTFG